MGENQLLEQMTLDEVPELVDNAISMLENPDTSAYLGSFHDARGKRASELIALLIGEYIRNCSSHADTFLRHRLMECGTIASAANLLMETIDSHKYRLRKLSAGIVDWTRSCSFPQFADIEWRVEAVVASRALPVLKLQCTEIVIRIQLSTSSFAGSENHVRNVLLKISPSDLLFILSELESALQFSI